MGRGSVKFGEFELDRSAYQLRRAGEVVRLERIPFDLLSFLVERAGELLSREEIVEQIWGKDVYLDTENGINTAIRKIRLALQDNSETPRFVLTVPTKGYRFVAAVEGMQGNSAAEIRENPHRVMLAVLPFLNLSNDADQEYFVDGLTEQTITDLGEFGSTRLGVIARTSSMNYKSTKKDVSEIGRELKVDFVVAGSVRRNGNQLRISVQLIKTGDQTHLWAHSYDCEMRNVLQVQADFGRAIADQVRGKLEPADGVLRERIATSSEGAHQAFLHGRFHLWKVMRPSIELAIRYFEEATRLDPQMAVAHAGLADAYDILPITSDASPREAFPKSERAALRALEIDAESSEANATLASIRFWFDWDWKGSEEHAVRAIKRNPSNALAHLRYGHLLSNIGRHGEAIMEIETARRLDPLSLITNTLCAQFRFQAGNYDEVAPLLERTLQLEPRFWVALILAAKFYIQRKQYEKAVTAAQQARDFSGGNTEAVALAGAAHGLMGHRREAEAIVARLLKIRQQQYLPAYNFATVYSAMGERESALEWLEKAVEERGVHVVFLKVEPQWDVLRKEERFRGVMRAVGFA